MRNRSLRLGCAILVLLSTLSRHQDARAHDPEEASIEVPEVTVKAERAVAASSQQFIPDREYLLQPQGRPAQILRLIPGFMTLEHTGGAGKADEYFLRGFAADHGTDIAFFTDGMPINLRSHPAGQGYTDLNFIIPETIEGLDVYKGAYHVEFGDFATAGAVNFKTREIVKEGVAQLSGGMFDTQRHLLMLSPTQEKVRTLLATEAYFTNGPFEAPNRYFRVNSLGKATFNPSSRSEFSFTGTFHQSRWNASGQIPTREIQSGALNRFGSIDPSEGGNTMRATGRMAYHYDTPTGGKAFANLYAQYYREDLFSNFTLFLNDPVNGDGIVQADRRVLYGGDVGWRQEGELLGLGASATMGLQTRIDRIQNRLGLQVRRAPLGTATDSDISQASYSPYLKLEFQLAPWLRVSGGPRADFFTFDVQNRCPTCVVQPAGRHDSAIITPKANAVLGPWFNTEVFLNYGEGYHSNDARGVVTGGVPLARAKSYEAGIRHKPWDEFEFISTLWMLDLQSELVFVGDEGTTEARGSTRRYGVEIGAKGQLIGPLHLNSSFTWTHANFRQTGEAIPLAPEYTAYAAVLLRWPEGLSSQLQVTHLGARPLVQDRSVKAPSWTVCDLIERYQLPIRLRRGRLEAFLSIQNIFDTQWESGIFFFQSRLRRESSGVDDVHIVPGMPRSIMGGLAWYF